MPQRASFSGLQRLRGSTAWRRPCAMLGSPGAWAQGVPAQTSERRLGLETGDTASTAPTWLRRAWPIALIAALWACDPGKSKAPAWDFAACDPATDYERCDANTPGLRWRCVATAAVWQSIGYCPQLGLCTPAPLPSEATAGEGTACLPRPADASGSTDIGSADSGSDGLFSSDTPVKDTLGDGAIGGLCGNGVCDQEEAAGSCPSDCAKATCGDGQCQATEQKTCAYDCVSGAKAAVSCALSVCPGQAAQCQAKPSCLIALAAIWACTQGCSGCLASCLKASPPDAVVYAVASCGAPSCF
jgi:hypothetical protein